MRFLLCLLLFVLPPLASAGEAGTPDADDAESGAWVLTLKPAADLDPRTLEGAFTQGEEGCRLVARTPDGKAAIFTGRELEGGLLLLWMSSAENGKIVTFHLTGSRKTRTFAGTFSIHQDHDQVGRGTWRLAPAEMAKDGEG